jgi:hypothetical protein
MVSAFGWFPIPPPAFVTHTLLLSLNCRSEVHQYSACVAGKTVVFIAGLALWNNLMGASVHNCRQMHAMPMYGGTVVQVVLDIHVYHISLVNKQGRSPELSIYASGNGLIPGIHNLRKGVFDGQIKLCSRKGVGNPKGIV